jgi:hypothetical protein
MSTGEIAKFLELAMILCFGAAWPASLFKSWRSRTAKGKSLFFLCIVLAGYIAGLAKTILLGDVGSLLMAAYSLNFVMVSADTVLYLRNASLDRDRDSRGTQSP